MGEEGVSVPLGPLLDFVVSVSLTRTPSHGMDSAPSDGVRTPFSHLFSGVNGEFCPDKRPDHLLD